MKRWKSNTNKSEPNGKKKARNSLKRMLKMQSTEPPPSKHGTLSMKGSMKTNPCGLKTRPKSPSQNTDNFIKTSSRIRAIL